MLHIIIIGYPLHCAAEMALAGIGHVIHHTTQDFEGVLVANESKMVQIVNYPSRTELPLEIILAPAIETPFVEQPTIRYLAVVMLLISAPIRGDWMHLRWRPPWQRILGRHHYVVTVFFYNKKTIIQRNDGF